MSDGIVLQEVRRSVDQPIYGNEDAMYSTVDAEENNTYENVAFNRDEVQPYTTKTSATVNPVLPTVNPVLPTNVLPAETSNDNEYQSLNISKTQRLQQQLMVKVTKHASTIRMTFWAVLILAYAVFFGYAMSRGLYNEDQIRLLWITCVVVFFCIVALVRQMCGDVINTKVIEPLTDFIKQHFTIFKWVFIGLFLFGTTVFIIVDIAIDYPSNLISITGFVLYIFLLFIFSFDPSKVRWRPVCWGLGIQFVFALLILRTSWGFAAFEWLGDRVSEFLVHADAGSEFVFGENYTDHMFAFQVLPVVIFFSTVISVLYYLGVMQFVIFKMAWAMQRTLGTTAAESVNAAGNIFIGQTEAPLLIRPLIEDMSASELHAVMTGGFATIAGSVMASFIMFGVQANHLITASVMAAPCALAMSKLSYPEMTKTEDEGKEIEMEKPDQQNIIEAASAGATSSISLVANIAANLIAFMALLAFVNATLQWMGDRVGLTPPDYPALTFQLICSYLLFPFAVVMGVHIDDCQKVAELIGIKTFINEFFAYTELGKLIDNRAIFDAYTGNYTWVNGDILLDNTGEILVGGVISPRSTVISTYALCGFANISSIGMVMGALGSMSDKQKPIIARIALRAMITGNIVSFMNACTAGLLYRGT